MLGFESLSFEERYALFTQSVMASPEVPSRVGSYLFERLKRDGPEETYNTLCLVSLVAIFCSHSHLRAQFCEKRHSDVNLFLACTCKKAVYSVVCHLTSISILRLIGASDASTAGCRCVTLHEGQRRAKIRGISSPVPPAIDARCQFNVSGLHTPTRRKRPGSKRVNLPKRLRGGSAGTVNRAGKTTRNARRTRYRVKMSRRRKGRESALRRRGRSPGDLLIHERPCLQM